MCLFVCVYLFLCACVSLLQKQYRPIWFVVIVFHCYCSKRPVFLYLFRCVSSTLIRVKQRVNEGNQSNERTISNVDFPVAYGTREVHPNREAVSQCGVGAASRLEAAGVVESPWAAVVVVRHSQWPLRLPSAMHKPRDAGVAAFDSPWDRGCLPQLPMK